MSAAAAAVGSSSSAGKHTIQWSNVALMLQIDGLTLQQEEQQQQQQIRQQALSALQGSIEDELQPQRKQLREQALAAMENDVTSSLQVQAQLGKCINIDIQRCTYQICRCKCKYWWDHKCEYEY